MSSNFADRCHPPVLTSSGQDGFKFGRLMPRFATRTISTYWHLVVKVSSNLADLLLDLPPDLPSLVLTSSGQDEFKFGRSNPRSASRSNPLNIAICWSRWVQIWQIYPLILTSSSQDEFKFGRSIPQYWHLVDKMGSNLADWHLDLPPDPPLSVLTSSGQDEFKFGRSTPRSAGRSTTPQYWYLVVKMSSNLADLPLDQTVDLSLSVLTSSGQDEFKFGRSTHNTNI